ncbi:complement C4-like, partial [Oxyura jamaicensis]|uniref:complement C4-like n=1 Tax=Oxyura jamaicensis TaxID=8884 RepID=UPI0015A5BD1A
MSPPNATCQGLGLEVAITGPILYQDEEDYEDYEEEAELEGRVEPSGGAEPPEGVGPAGGAGLSEAAAPLSPMALWDARQRRRRDVHDPGREVAFLVCFWRGPGAGLAGMAVVEVSLLSGFRPHQPDLDKVGGTGVPPGGTRG